VEAATDELEREAERLLDEIESRGGALQAIERGEMQRQIQDSAYRHQQQVESGERIIVGVNRFLDAGEEASGNLLRIEPAVERDQIERLRALRQRRDPEAWQASLTVLGDQARAGERLMPAIVEAVSASATVGEITGTLREVFGEHRENLVL
jgi:methylmalonyl-CoA mutase N-terminal domain/subunit